MPKERLTPGEDESNVPSWLSKKISPLTAQDATENPIGNSVHGSTESQNPRSIELAIFVTALRRRPLK